MSYLAVTAWLFGKLPSHGDFVSRGLTAAARDELDRWLSAEVLSAREAYGAAFDGRYDAAPPWRFAGEGEGRVICASIDSAGRRFPVIAGLGVADAALARSAAEACERTIYAAFARTMTIDAVWKSLSSEELRPEEPPAAPGWWLEGTRALAAGDRPEGLLTHMLAMEPA